MNKNELKYKAADAAIEFRRRFDLGQAAPLRMDVLLAKLDLLTVFAKMSESFSGMAAKFEDNGFLLINCNHVKGRQNFTICHELYHLFVQKDFQFEIIASNEDRVKDEHEKLADAFASELLMPEEGIKELLLMQNFLSKQIGIEQIVKLEQYFQVSRQAMVYRLVNLGLIDKQTDLQKAYFETVKESAERLGFETQLYEATSPKVISSDYFEKGQLLYKQEIIGLADFAQLMDDIGIDIYPLLEQK
ncbi:ImmA/IrrE family metallo-endopeptidase [Fluviicola taffensis]|uniref:IrrE N-terminal-like domain-containing protein n=1 Tax=Fluviicola taffensis (strain DSM 16823 / NCIMB 13979 / RW262) TaxID=755732 RepID=F2IGZ0_FLUTR|nr:ImmA/IrrE family metallo-endopeptidase [Fluviicola taffensis]AEA44771.1 protein of unknown function DUF955 [Fluviicola taffensis DSM 16823]